MPNPTLEGYNLTSNTEDQPDLLAPIKTETIPNTTPPIETNEQSVPATRLETDLPESAAFNEFREAAYAAMENLSAQVEDIDHKEQQLADEIEEAQQKFEQTRLALMADIEKVVEPGRQQLEQLVAQIDQKLAQFPNLKPGQESYLQRSFLKVETEATGNRLRIGEKDLKFRSEAISNRLANDVLEKKSSENSAASNITDLHDFKSSRNRSKSDQYTFPEDSAEAA